MAVGVFIDLAVSYLRQNIHLMSSRCRLQVKRSRSKGGLAGPDGTKSVFGQMCAKMSSFSPDSLLLPHRVWKVKFVGRSSTVKISSCAECLNLWTSSFSFLRRVCGRLRWRLQRINCRNVRGAAKWSHATAHRHSQWARRVGRQQGLFPPQPRSQVPSSHEHVPLPRYNPPPLPVGSPGVLIPDKQKLKICMFFVCLFNIHTVVSLKDSRARFNSYAFQRVCEGQK